jgi:uncharacterized SAM-binding protein YcdF (DUF218 family)
MKSLGLLLLLVLIWGAGLFAFAYRVAQSTPAPDPPKADAIVVLTGASTLRLEAGAELLEDGLGKRLLISGVNREATRKQVRDTVASAGRKFDCCVDLGFKAENTQGNARETAAWVAFHKYRTLIVVTADFHMPRALLELKAAMPKVQLYAYPVQTETVDAHTWWAAGGDMRRMMVEYSKYIVIAARAALLGLAHPAPDAGTGLNGTSPELGSNRIAG